MYKEYVKIAFSFDEKGSGDREGLIKFERRMNNLIEKSADLLDLLEEMVRKEAEKNKEPVN